MDGFDSLGKEVLRSATNDPHHVVFRVHSRRATYHVRGKSIQSVYKWCGSLRANIGNGPDGTECSFIEWDLRNGSR